jgi:ABC-type uncharacterized transport system substrate-binding protein
MLVRVMKHFYYSVSAALVSLVAVTSAAIAHPHVWITIRAELMYSPDGAITGIRHAWTFDDMFSAFAVQGIDTSPASAPSSAPAKASGPKVAGFFGWLQSEWNRMWGRNVAADTEQKGEKKELASSPNASASVDGTRGPAREQLQLLAKVNVESLKDSDYFTDVRINGEKAQFADPPETYYFDFQNQVLTLHFTLPLKETVKARKVEFQIYDPSYYVHFSFAKDDPVALAGAPAVCKLVVGRPQQMDGALAAQFSQLGAGVKLDASQLLGMQFANHIVVRCT